MYKALIVCHRCGAEHGLTEVRRIVRVTCDRCGVSVDSDGGQVLPSTWSIQHSNILRYTLCEVCTQGLDAFCTGRALVAGPVKP